MQNQIIFITGCSTGFGRQAAERFAKQGCRVYATMRGIDGKNRAAAAELRALAGREGMDIRVLELDVTLNASVEAAARIALDESGAPDVIINNAGQMFTGLTEAFSAEELARQLDINVVGVHRVSRAFLPAMRQRRSGLFINVGSVAGRFYAPFFGIYNASKYAVEGYSGALRLELASSGVDVVIIEPGPFATQLLTQSPRPADADSREQTYPEILHRTQEGIADAFAGCSATRKLPIPRQLLTVFSIWPPCSPAPDRSAAWSDWTSALPI